MKRGFIKIICAAAAVLSLSLVLAGCGVSQITQPAPDEGVTPTKITGSCTLEKIDESTLRVRCTTDLMDGAIVGISIDSYNGEVLAEQTFTKKGDNFYADFTIDPKWDEPIYGNVVCSPNLYGGQPDAVKNAYGAKLQNIEGDSVIWNLDGNVVVFQSEIMREY